MAGRGRLSIIEQLPEDFDDIVLWASTELRERKQLQIDILAEFNKRLKARSDEIGIDVPAISSSAFNRYSIRLARLSRRMEEAREITRVLTDRLEPGQTDDLTIAAAEMVKTLVLELLEAGGDGGINTKGAQELAAAIKNAAAAQAMSADRRRKLEEEMAAKTKKALNEVAKIKGVTKETMDEINRRLGVV